MNKQKVFIPAGGGGVAPMAVDGVGGGLGFIGGVIGGRMDIILHIPDIGNNVSQLEHGARQT